MLYISFWVFANQVTYTCMYVCLNYTEWYYTIGKVYFLITIFRVHSLNHVLGIYIYVYIYIYIYIPALAMKYGGSSPSAVPNP